MKWLMVLAAAATLSAAGAAKWTLAHLPDGQPDFQGYWTNATYTPLERDRDLGTKEFFTPEEAAAYAKKREQIENSQSKDDIHYDNVIWQNESYGKIVTRNRTSLIYDPPDGRIPELTPAAKAIVAARIIGIDAREARVSRSCEFGATDVFVTREPGGRDAIDHVAQLTGGAMADLVVEAVGHEEQQFNLAAALARNKGRVLYFGIPPDKDVDVTFEPVVRKSLTIHTSVPEDLRPFVRIAQRMIARGRIDPARLITHRFPFAQVQTAFETYRDRRDGALKVLLDF